jgi:hypothetical protein
VLLYGRTDMESYSVFVVEKGCERYRMKKRVARQTDRKIEMECKKYRYKEKRFERDRR